MEQKQGKVIAVCLSKETGTNKVNVRSARFIQN